MMGYNRVYRGAKLAVQSRVRMPMQVSPHPHEFELYFDL